MRVPLRRTQMGRAANSAALPLGSDWSSCSCRLPRSRFSHLGGSRAPLRAWVVVQLRRARVGRRSARGSAETRPRGGVCFVLGFVMLWRLAKRAKRLRISQNVTALNHRPRRSGSGAGTEPWTGRSTSRWRCPEPDLICLAPWLLRWWSVVLLHLHIYHMWNLKNLNEPLLESQECHF